MLNYIIRRLILMVPTLIGVTAVVFFIMAMAPGGVGGPQMDELGQLDAQQARALRDYYNERYGLDDPPIVQYGRWLHQVSPVGVWHHERGAPDAGWGIPLGTTELDEVRRLGFKLPDLGQSFARGRPVLDLFKDALPITIVLNVLSIPIVYVIAVVVGIYAARHRGGAFDVTSSITMLGLWAVPPIWAGVLLIGFLANEQSLRWFPTGGVNHTFADSMAFLPTGPALLQTISFAAFLVLVTTTVLAGILAVAGSGVALILAVLGRLDGSTTGWAAAKTGMWGGAATLVAGGLLWGGWELGLLTSEMAGPERGWLLDRLYHLVLPVICLSYTGFAFISKLERSSMLENLSADFVRTARAKGVDENTVLWRHVFRNSLLPLITVATTILPAMLAGSVIIESIFSIPGMGQLTIEAIFNRDREVVLAGALVGGVLGLIAILIADISYAVADPRVSYE